MITLTWMIEQLQPHLTFEISTPQFVITDRYSLVRPVLDELFKDQRKYKEHWIIKKINALKDKEGTAPDVWNDKGLTWSRNIAADALMGWATGPIIDSYEGRMTKAGSKYRTPGAYKEGKLGRTNEMIHPTVAYRKERLHAEGTPYLPEPLKDWNREKVPEKQKHEDGSIKEVFRYEWVSPSGIRIPEYKIRGETLPPNIERVCIYSPSASSWIGVLDKEYGIKSKEAFFLDNPPTKEPGPENKGFDPKNSGFGTAEDEKMEEGGDPFLPTKSVGF